MTQYITSAGLMPALESLKFNLVGYGCTTCNGNSGPLAEPISKSIQDGDTAAELEYCKHGGILQFVLRELMKS